MQLFLIALSALLAVTSGRKFNNPVLDNGDYPDPGAIKFQGVYYVVTTTNNLDPNKYPIHTSTDLQNFTLSGYVFSGNNIPVWGSSEREFWAPEIHRLSDSDFRIYFTSRDMVSGKLTIGVATAPHPLGPWKAADRPIWADPNGDVLDSTLVNDNGNLILMWKGGEGAIWARPLNRDGLSFSSNETTRIFRNELPWEDTIVEAPWYVRRGDWHYLFYSGHDYCSELYRVGIARSRNAIGPYEKRGDPILASNQAFKGPGHNSVVKDLNDQDDVIVFHAFKDQQVCSPWPRLTLLASVGWGTDDWPYIYDWN